MSGASPCTTQSFSTEEYNRLDGILDHADQFQAGDHAGPVVYAVLRDLPLVWPTP